MGASIVRDPRYRRAAATAAAGLIARAVALGLTLVTVPLTLQYLGSERYGLWVAISSAVALLGFTDLGLGHGVLNAVTGSLAKGDTGVARQQISSAIGLLAAVVMACGAALLLVGSFIPWARIAAVHSPEAAAEAGPALAVAALCFLAGQPIAVASQVRLARQEGWSVHLVAAAGNVAAVMALLVVIAGKGGLPMLALAMSLPPILAAAVNAALLYGRDAPALRPSIKLFNRSMGVALLRSGSLFLVLELSMTVAFSSDAIVLAQLRGPEAVATYGVTARLFVIPFGLVALGLAPLWPAYGEAITRRDLGWVHTTLRRSTIAAGAVAGAGALVLVITGPALIRLWVDGRVDPTFDLVAGFGLWIVLSAVGTSVAMFLNGAGEIKLQAIAASIMAITNLALSIILTVQIGVAGVIWGTVISYAALTLVPMAVYVPRVLRRIKTIGPAASQDLAR